MRKGNLVITAAIAALIGLGVFGVSQRSLIREKWSAAMRPELPIALPADVITYKDTDSQDVKDNDVGKEEPLQITSSERASLPDSYNLAVPFTPQAPHANWDQPYQDACEEASALMVKYFYEQKTFNPDLADREILDVVAWEDAIYGYNKDTDAKETVQTIEEYFGNSAELIYDFTVDDVKIAISSGYPVIIPAYGKALKNPHFKNGGPVYHMLVIKGYTEDEFITNDPGTRRGADYIYPYERILDAAHDYNNGDVPNGRRVMIIVKPR